MFIFELKDNYNLSIEEIFIEAENLAWKHCELTNEVLAYVDVDTDYIIDGDVKIYKVTAYSQPKESPLTQSLNIGDRVINDLDGKEYKVIAISSRKSDITNLLGNNVYLAGLNGENIVVYEWEVTKLC